MNVGGELRRIYAVDVFDYRADYNNHFVLEIGISAGNVNLASFAVGQSGRNWPSYMGYTFRKQYINVRNFILKRSFTDINGLFCNAYKKK